MRLVALDGKEYEVGCLGCDIVEGRFPIFGDNIIETKHFAAHQDVLIPIPGFVIIASHRHIQRFDQLTEEELDEFIHLIARLRKGMKEALGIKQVYFVQEEDTEDHFHVWLFPKFEWMEDDLYGRKVAGVRAIMKHAQEHMMDDEHKELVLDAVNKLRGYLKDTKSL